MALKRQTSGVDLERGIMTWGGKKRKGWLAAAGRCSVVMDNGIFIRLWNSESSQCHGAAALYCF